MSKDMELINKIEAQISELENRFKKNNEFISSANVSIEKLNADKTSAVNDSNIINGALQAFRGVIAEIKSIDESFPANDPANEPNEPSVCVGE